MTDSRITLLGGEFAARALKATAQTRQNIYLDVSALGDKSKIVGYLMPGLSNWYTYNPGGANPSAYIHGLHWWQDVNAVLVATTLAGGGTGIIGVNASKSISTSAGSFPMAANGQATFASYGKKALIAGGTGSYAVAVDGSAYPFLSFSNVATFMTTTPGWCTYLDGRFILPYNDAPGQFAWSGLLDPTSWLAGDYSTAESSSDPLVRGIAWRGILILFGTRTTEFWQGTGDGTTPFQLISGSVGDYGCIGSKSVQIVAETVIFAARMPQGNRTICRLNGYEAEPISTPDIDYMLAQEGSILYSCTYRVSGHSFYEITLANGSTPVTYCYDLQSGVWSVRVTNGLTCSQTTCSTPFLDASGNDIVLTGSSRGPINSLSATTYTEDNSSGTATAIPWSLVMPHVFDSDGLNQIRAPMLRLDMQGGDVATGKPTVDLYISRDGGLNYGNPLQCHFSSDSSPNFRPEWRRLGIARSFTFKLTGQNNCKTAIINAFLLDMDKAEK